MDRLNLNKTKKLILDLISFGTPQAIVINIFLILFFLSILPTEKLVYLPIPSVFKDFILPAIFHGNCPSSGFLKDCHVYSTGLTRATSYFLHGNFKQAYEMNKLVFLLMPILISIFIINLVKWIKKYK